MIDGRSKRRLDLTGHKSGFLTAIRDVGSNGKKRLWLVLCVCGRKVKMNTRDVRVNQSCGCKKNELIAAKQTRHGLSHHPLHAVWDSMLGRCDRPSHKAWKNYGGRGIKVCKRWHVFDNFYADMGATYERGLTLERKNNDKGYSKVNCVWATYTEQASNRRGNVFVETPWGKLTASEAARRLGLDSSTIRWRIKNNWPADKWLIAADTAQRIRL